MQFNVPQFIDIEDKVFGPLTFKQFAYILGGAGAAFVIYTFLPLTLAILFITPVGIIVFLLAFKPVHGRPFSLVIESAFKYAFGSKLYLWKKEERKREERIKTELQKRIPVTAETAIPRVTEGKLDDMSWNLDVKDKV